MLAIHRSVRSLCHTAASRIYRAIPWGACTRARHGVAELALRVHRLPALDEHPAAQLEAAANTLRAWWASQSSNRKRSAMDPFHDLVRELGKGDDLVPISPTVLTALELRVGIHKKLPDSPPTWA